MTNTAWRRAEDHLRDLADAAVENCVEGVITSVDVGRRKPDPALIQRALGLAGARPDQAIAIGSREDLDILPALTTLSGLQRRDERVVTREAQRDGLTMSELGASSRSSRQQPLDSCGTT